MTKWASTSTIFPISFTNIPVDVLFYKHFPFFFCHSNCSRHGITKRCTMKNILGVALLTTVCTLFTSLASAQMRQVFIDNTKRTFNEGNPLPSGEYFQVTGGIPADVSHVILKIYSKPSDRSPIYTGEWKRHFSDKSQSFYIPVDEKLSPNREYTLRLTYLETVRDEKLRNFRQRIHENLKSYVEAVTITTGDRIRLNGSVNQNMERLKKLVTDGYRYYETRLPDPFPGFSDLVRLNLEQINNASLEDARYNIATDTGMSEHGTINAYSQQLQQSLIEQLKREADDFMAAGIRSTYDEIAFSNYPTERRRSFLPLNVGYGAVYLGGSANDLEYDAQPYAGVSIPLGNPRIRKFLGNASVSFGVFLRNFQDGEGNTLTGPLVGRPFYLGLGYKVFDFLKFNAGAVALSEDRLDLNSFRTEAVTIQPFVGLSVEFNIFFGGSR